MKKILTILMTIIFIESQVFAQLGFFALCLQHNIKIDKAGQGIKINSAGEIENAGRVSGKEIKIEAGGDIINGQGQTIKGEEKI